MVKKINDYLYKEKYFPLILFILLFISLISNNLFDIISGYKTILFSESTLITDYFEISNFGATFFNVFINVLFYYLLIKHLKIEIDGPIYAGLLTILGFSFFGKNIINGLPILYGIYLYSKFVKEDFKKFSIIILFSQGLSPLVSGIAFSDMFLTPYNLILGIVFGIISGFILSPLVNHVFVLHKGYNLYNTGLALGFISFFFYALLKNVFKKDIYINTIYSNDYHIKILIFIILFSLLFLIIGLILSKFKLNNYYDLLKTSGKMPMDYIRDYNLETVLINSGILGLFGVFMTLILNFNLNGPLLGAIITLMAFGSFGKHIINVLPITLGSIIMVKIIDGNDFRMGFKLAILFSSTLAPTSGRYGFVFGIIVGFTHIILYPLLLNLQMGYNLYLNGFVGGIVSLILIPIVEIIEKRRKDDYYE